MSSHSFSKNRPIEEVMVNLESLMIDIKGIKTEIIHIKEYIRKIEIRKQIEEEKQKKIEDEYVKPSLRSVGWFY